MYNRTEQNTIEWMRTGRIKPGSIGCCVIQHHINFQAYSLIIIKSD